MKWTRPVGDLLARCQNLWQQMDQEQTVEVKKRGVCGSEDHLLTRGCDHFNLMRIPGSQRAREEGREGGREEGREGWRVSEWVGE